MHVEEIAGLQFSPLGSLMASKKWFNLGSSRMASKRAAFKKATPAYTRGSRNILAGCWIVCNNEYDSGQINWLNLKE